jgi:Mg2+-importing ATPase
MANAVHPDQSPVFWPQSAAGLMAALDSGTHGLTVETARLRLASAGPNVLVSNHKRALLLQFLLHFRNPLVLILLAASTIAAVLGDAQSVIVIVIIVVLSVTLDFVQEYRAGSPPMPCVARSPCAPPRCAMAWRARCRQPSW